MSKKVLKLRVTLGEKKSAFMLSKVLLFGKKPISKSPEELKQAAIEIAKKFPGVVPEVKCGKISKDDNGELYVIMDINGDFDPVNLGIDMRNHMSHADIVTWGD